MGRYEEEEEMRRCVAARAAGDRAAMRRSWDVITTSRFDWIALNVKLGARGRLDRQEIEDATQLAATRISVDLFRTFTGSTMGEWAAAAKRIMHFSRVDTQRDSERAHAGVSSLDSSYETPEGKRHSAYDEAMLRSHLLEESQADADEADAELDRYGRAFLAWALPQLTEKRRILVEHDARGASTEEIQAALGGASAASVYQTRKRAYDTLDELKRTYES